MANKITGRAEILVNGVKLLNKSGAVAMNIGPGDGNAAVKRTMVVGDSGVHGYSEEIAPARLEVTITDRDDKFIADLYALDGDGVVIFRTINGGKVYTMTGVACMEPGNVTAGEGEVPLVFESITGGWIEISSPV